MSKRLGFEARQATVPPTRFVVTDCTDVSDPTVLVYSGTVRPHPRDRPPADGSAPEKPPRLLMDGRGRAECANGDVYEGDVVLGMFEGVGKVVYADGGVYDGQWQAHLRHGYGVCDSADGKTSYMGVWRAGERDGTGDETTPEGSYAGLWRGGHQHGVGRWRPVNGDVYDGVWAGGKLHGLCTVTYAHGDVLTAHFVEGLLHGSASYTQQSTGDKYGEDFVRGVCVRGVTCKESVSQHPRHGALTQCTVEYQRSGDVYIGQWLRTRSGDDRRGERCGTGRLEWADGDVYVGEFAEDHLDGDGVVTYAERDADDVGKLDDLGLSHLDDAVVAAEDEDGEVDEGCGRSPPGGEGFVADVAAVPDLGTGPRLLGGGDSGQYGGNLDDVAVAAPQPDRTEDHERTVDGVRVLRYEGQFHKGLRDGRGRLVLANGDHVDGFWSGGFRHGVFHRTVANKRWEAAADTPFGGCVAPVACTGPRPGSPYGALSRTGVFVADGDGNLEPASPLAVGVDTVPADATPEAAAAACAIGALNHAVSLKQGGPDAACVEAKALSHPHRGQAGGSVTVSSFYAFGDEASSLTDVEASVASTYATQRQAFEHRKVAIVE